MKRNCLGKNEGEKVNETTINHQQPLAVKSKRPPSIEAVKSFYRGDSDSVRRLVGTYIGRAAMLAIGFSLLSDKDKAIKNGLIGSAVIELYLLYFYRNRNS